MHRTQKAPILLGGLQILIHLIGWGLVAMSILFWLGDKSIAAPYQVHYYVTLAVMTIVSVTYLLRRSGIGSAQARAWRRAVSPFILGLVIWTTLFSELMIASLVADERDRWSDSLVRESRLGARTTIRGPGPQATLRTGSCVNRMNARSIPIGRDTMPESIEALLDAP